MLDGRCRGASQTSCSLTGSSCSAVRVLVRPDDATSPRTGQREVLATELDAYARAAMLPLAILDARRSAGCARITPEQHHRAARSSPRASVTGSASRASAAAWPPPRWRTSSAIAFNSLGLHRLEAATLLHNTPLAAGAGAQRLPAVRGSSESYLKIDGRVAGSHPVPAARTDDSPAAHRDGRSVAAPAIGARRGSASARPSGRISPAWPDAGSRPGCPRPPCKRLRVLPAVVGAEKQLTRVREQDADVCLRAASIAQIQCGQRLSGGYSSGHVAFLVSCLRLLASGWLRFAALLTAQHNTYPGVRLP